MVTEQTAFTFDGGTISEDPDAPVRLTGQMLRVVRAVANGEWWTLHDLAVAAEGTEAAVSARLRDLRKPRMGSNTVERRLVRPGLFEYRVIFNEEHDVAS